MVNVTGIFIAVNIDAQMNDERREEKYEGQCEKSSTLRLFVANQ
jgi:hypothetical protein